MVESSAPGAPMPRLVTEAQIDALVRRFYELARADELLEPVLSTWIHDWDAHRAIVQAFWSHTLRGTRRYGGSVYQAHVNRGITAGQFPRWLALFEQAARETLDEPAAERAMRHARRMAESIGVGLFTAAPAAPSQATITELRRP